MKFVFTPFSLILSLLAGLVGQFRLVKGLTDHGARVAFSRSTGIWPGEETPDPR